MGIWKKGGVHDGTIFCWGTGKKCLVEKFTPHSGRGSFRFLAPGSQSVMYDNALTSVAEKLNCILDDMNKKTREDGAQLGMLFLTDGICFVWKKTLPELDEAEEKVVQEFIDEKNIKVIDDMNDTEIREIFDVELPPANV